MSEEALLESGLTAEQDKFVHERTLAAVIQSLRGPLSSDACCLAAVVKGIRILPREHDHPQLAPDMLLAIMHFLSVDRSTEVIQRIMESFVRTGRACHCDQQVWIKHVLHNCIIEDGPTRNMPPFNFVCRSVVRSLATLARGHFRKIRVPGSNPWPSNFNDLLQGAKSCERVVASLYQWIEHSLLECSPMFAIFSHLSIFSRHFVAELDKPQVMQWFERALQLLQILLDDKPQRDWTLCVDSFMEPLANATIFIDTVTSLRSENRINVSLHRPEIRPYFANLISQILDIVNSPFLNVCASENSDYFQPCWSAIRERATNGYMDSMHAYGIVPKIYTDLPGNFASVDRFMPERGHALTLRRLLYDVKSRDQCMNPLCAGSEMKSKRTKVCEGCATLRFCSTKVWMSSFIFVIPVYPTQNLHGA